MPGYVEGVSNLRESITPVDAFTASGIALKECRSSAANRTASRLNAVAQHVALCRDQQELEKAAGQLLPALVGLDGAKQIALVRNSTEGAAVRAMVRRCGEICL